VLNANKAITQVIKVIREADKAEQLMSVLKEVNPSGEPAQVPKTIIFLSRKWACDKLANDLWDAGYSVDSLHGDKQQYERTKVMDQFKRSKIRVLIATDVAARGLDVKDIEVVINYDFPAGSGGVEDYVHRIGRTARGSCTEGKAFTFFTDADAKNATKLIGVLQRAGQQIPEDLKKFGGGGGGGFNRGFGGNNRWGGGGGGRGFGGRGGGGRGRKW
jgi:ATP-dependent RNA helicase DDX5/DBP2